MFVLLGLLHCWLSSGVHVAGVVTLWFQCWCSCYWGCGLSAGVHVAGVVTLWLECWCSCCWGCYIVVRVLVFMLLVLLPCG